MLTSGRFSPVSSFSGITMSGICDSTTCAISVDTAELEVSFVDLTSEGALLMP